MALAPGYLLTWHTYGTWLHGDDAGSVDQLHNLFGSPKLEGDPSRFRDARLCMKDPPLVLAPMARVLVDKIMREHCRIRHWTLLALRVRSNHAHVVIVKPEIGPELIVKQLKDWGTRTLRAHRIVGVEQCVWADHGSMIFLFQPGSVDRAVEYVLKMQDDPPPGHGRDGWLEKLGSC